MTQYQLHLLRFYIRFTEFQLICLIHSVNIHVRPTVLIIAAIASDKYQHCFFKLLLVFSHIRTVFKLFSPFKLICLLLKSVVHQSFSTVLENFDKKGVILKFKTYIYQKSKRFSLQVYLSGECRHQICSTAGVARWKSDHGKARSSLVSLSKNHRVAQIMQMYFKERKSYWKKHSMVTTSEFFFTISPLQRPLIVKVTILCCFNGLISVILLL